jgi:NTP pyrophosphatase (non-canonical NTP hydrolase)
MQAINAARSARWMAGSPGWTTLEIAGELAGEVGELANVCKKLRRSEMGVPGNKVSDDELRQQARSEMADVFIVLMLTASKLGVDLYDAVCDTFNAKSEQMGFPERFGPTPTPDAIRASARFSSHPIGTTCGVCDWTNVGLLNVGDPGRPMWMCHGCIKRAVDAQAPALPVPGEDAETPTLQELIDHFANAHYVAGFEAGKVDAGETYEPIDHEAAEAALVAHIRALTASRPASGRDDRARAAPAPEGVTPDALAQRFHEAYERLAPSFGYATREASAKPWAEVPENNRRLMTAVCAEILAAPRSGAGEEIRSLREFQQRYFPEHARVIEDYGVEWEEADRIIRRRALAALSPTPPAEAP